MHEVPEPTWTVGSAEHDDARAMACLSMHNGTVLVLLQESRLKAADVKHPVLGCFGVGVEKVWAD